MAMFRRGDANYDQRIDLADAVHLLQYLNGDSDEVYCEDAADINDSGEIDFTDPLLLLEFLFLGHTTNPNLALAGPDTTEDDLGCGGTNGGTND